MEIINKIDGLDYLSGYAEYKKDERFKDLETKDMDLARDSAIRALSLVSDKSYVEVYKDLFDLSLKQDNYIGSLPNNTAIVDEYLMNNMNMYAYKYHYNYFTVMDFLISKEINDNIILLLENKYYVPIIKNEIIYNLSDISMINNLLLVKNVNKIYYPSTNIDYNLNLYSNMSILSKFCIDKKENNNPNMIIYSNDCVIRSISYATDKSWEETYKKLFNLSIEAINEDVKEYRDKCYPLYNSKLVYKRYLKSLGFDSLSIIKRKLIPINFFKYNRKGLFIIVTTHHMMVYDDGVLVDNFIGALRFINRSLIDPIVEIYFKKDSIDTLYI